jgi:hypothetical protein
MNKFNNVLAIHCHTTGMNFNGPKTLGHQPLTISLAVFDLDNLKIIDSINVAVEYNPDVVKWDESLEKIHGITKAQALTGDSTTDAAAKLGGFIAEHFGINNKITTFGYNVNTFHLLFLEQVLQSEGLYFKFDERSVDLFPLATLIDKFTVYDTIKALFGEQKGPISSPEFIAYYIKTYKFLRLMVNKSLGN